MPDNMLEYRKTLSRPEARHRYWHIPKAEREFFPDSLEIFKMKFDGKVFEMKVNHKDDIMTGQLYARHQFLEGHQIIVTRDGDGSYSLEAPDTKLYQNID